LIKDDRDSEATIQMKKYLEHSEWIDWKCPQILAKATCLAKDQDNRQGIAKKCFEFVRDKIQHSWDYKLNPVTCKASDVLKHQTGYCFAKSHLLAALLRANNIPAGLCYQRLALDQSSFCLHGLNAIFLDGIGWYRVDPRGNKPGVTSEFSPPIENLAFATVSHGEAHLPEIWNEPLPLIVNCLNRYDTYDEVARNLPDIEIIGQ